MAKVNQPGANSAMEPLKHSSDLKIDFDGTTVLCRVCGDKASGFHYGVHSCEGCKGFFRRSIQQKIQYRPCTKNQQCAILRINRNRCQYCRLKKCIEVGMSRDAVRFGRVPKREKAKIMAEMQKQNAKSQASSLCAEMDDQESLLTLIVKAHEETCEYTKPKIIGILEQWRVTNHLPELSSAVVCPLNPSSSSPSSTQHLSQSGHPQTDTNTSGLDDFSDRFSPIIRGVVDFAKRLPGFLMLPQDDQVTLLKAGVFEILLVRLSRLFDATTNSLLCPNGQVLRRDLAALTGSNARFLVDSMFDFAERFNHMDLSDAEIAVFSAIALMANDRPGLRSIELVAKIQDAMKRCLERLLARSHPEQPEFYAQLLRKIPDLRTLNTLHSEKLIGCKMDGASALALNMVAGRSAGRWMARGLESTADSSPNSSFGRCGSSSPQSHSPTSVTSSETTRAADSGVESGSDCKFDLESDNKRRRTAENDPQPVKSPDCDMPVLKRALQAPPLSNSSEIYAEIYRTHKKFRAARKPDEARADSTTAPSRSPAPSPEDDKCSAERKTPSNSTRLHAALTQDSPLASMTMLPPHMMPGYGAFYGMGMPGGAGMMPASIAAVAGSAFTKASPFSFVSPFYPHPDLRMLHQQIGSISLYQQAFDMSMGFLPMAQSRMGQIPFPPLHQLHLETRSPVATSAPEAPLTSSRSRTSSPTTSCSTNPNLPLKRPASAMISSTNDSDQPLNLSKKIDLTKSHAEW